MALGDWTSAFEQLPPDSESAGLGDDRIRTLKEEVRRRGAVEHDHGGATIDAAYGDTGRLVPGAARIYRATGALPTALQKPDGSNQTSSLGSGDTGRLVLDQNGWQDALHMWDGGLSTPAWVNLLPTTQNLVLNGGMRCDQRGAGAARTLAAATRTRVLDGWAVTITGSAAGTVQQVTSGLPTGAVSDYGLKVVGAASVSNVDIDTRIRAEDALQWGGYVTVRLGWRYVDGAAGTITPSLRIDTADVSNVFTAVTNRATSAFTAGNDGYHTYTFDLSSLTNYANGVQIVVRLSGAADMNANTKSIVITDFSVTPGRAAPRRFTQGNYDDELRRCKRYYQKTFPYATAPAQNAGVTNAIYGYAQNNHIEITWMLEVEMIATPTITTYSPSSASAQWYNITDTADWAACTATGGTKNVRLSGDGGTSNRVIAIHAQAEAGL